jgi:hypothetical protein
MKYAKLPREFRPLVSFFVFLVSFCSSVSLSGLELIGRSLASANSVFDWT